MQGVSDIIRKVAMRKQANIWDRLKHRGDPGMLRRQALRHARSPGAKAVEMGAGGPEVIRGAKIGPPPGAADRAAPKAGPAAAPKPPFTKPVPGRAPMPNQPINIKVQMPAGAAGQVGRAAAPAAKGMGRYLKHTGLVGAAIAGGTLGVAGLAKAYDALTFKKDYEKMLDFAPEVKDYDSKAVKARFQTLRRFNPEMSRDPLVASSWVKQTMEYPVVTPATLKDVVRPREQVSIGDIGKALPKLPAVDPFGE